VPESPQAALPEAGPTPAVLDTQVVLDWLWFDDARAAALGRAVRSGHLRWIWTAAMREELAHVLPRLRPSASGISCEHVLTLCSEIASRANPPRVAALRCTDPSDQKFVDLALSVSGTWLFSRDRAVLKLARRAAPLGCRIVEPGRLAGQAEAFTSARRPGP